MCEDVSVRFLSSIKRAFMNSMSVANAVSECECRCLLFQVLVATTFSSSILKQLSSTIQYERSVSHDASEWIAFFLSYAMNVSEMRARS